MIIIELEFQDEDKNYYYSNDRIGHYGNKGQANYENIPVLGVILLSDKNYSRCNCWIAKDPNGECYLYDHLPSRSKFDEGWTNKFNTWWIQIFTREISEFNLRSDRVYPAYYIDLANDIVK